MRILMLDLYRILLRMTDNSQLSIIITLVYITVLNLITTYGFGILAEEFLPTHIVYTLFAYPYVFGTAIIMFLIDLWIMSPYRYLKKEKKNKLAYWGLVFYTGIAVLIFAYTKFNG